LLDLEAIVGQLGLETFALVGRFSSAPVAIAYAARNPERVSRLVLAPMSYARASDFNTPQVQRIWGLMEGDWELFTETVVRWALRWPEEEGAARRGAAYLRECVTQQEALAAQQSLQEIDVSDHLLQVRAPTLVVHVRASQLTDVNVAKSLAANISNARLVIVEEPEPALAVVNEFLGEGEEAAAAAGLASDDVHTILFTDVEGSTALTQRLGDAKARELLREHERMVREALKAHDGSEVKTMGNGFMASFSSATKALECAIAMQRAFAEHNESAEEAIRVRIGLNAGEPIAEDEDLFGTAVNLAARICSQAEAGQILAPIVVRELAAGKQFMFADLGETELRGFEDPVRLYELSWRA